MKAKQPATVTLREPTEIFFDHLSLLFAFFLTQTFTFCLIKNNPHLHFLPQMSLLVCFCVLIHVISADDLLQTRGNSLISGISDVFWAPDITISKPQKEELFCLGCVTRVFVYFMIKTCCPWTQVDYKVSCNYWGKSCWSLLDDMMHVFTMDNGFNATFYVLLLLLSQLLTWVKCCYFVLDDCWANFGDLRKFSKTVVMLNKISVFSDIIMKMIMRYSSW